MANFDPAVKVVLIHEGGWVDDPVDPGGETNFGWSMLMIKRLGLTPEQLGVPNFEPGCLKFMSVDTAKSLYRQHFWLSWFDQIDDQTAATKICDFGVNAGVEHAIQRAQRAANDCGAQLKVDGAMGPATVAAINAAGSGFVAAMAKEMEDYYRTVVANRPASAKFLPNWLHRAAWGVTAGK